MTKSLIIVVPILLIVIGVQAFFLWQNNNKSASPTPSASPEQSSSTAAEPKFEDKSMTGLVKSSRDAIRKSDISAYLDVLFMYKDKYGNFPPQITNKVQRIKTGEADLCSVLSPEFIMIMPKDPNIDGNIRDCNLFYDTGYTVVQDPTTGMITMSAPLAETKEVSVTR